MRILFDGATLCGKDGGPGAGIEHYSASLLSALAQQAPQDVFLVALPSYCSLQYIRNIIGASKNIKLLRTYLPHIPFVSRHLLFPLKAACYRPDVFFSPFGQLPLAWRGKSVLTVHDVAIYDHPEWFPEETAESFSTSFVVPSSFERTDALIAVSECTKEELTARFPHTRAKTHVVHEGVTLGNQKEIEHKERFPFDRDYVLFLGTVEPRKNLVHAIRAFDEFLQSRDEQAFCVRFIIAGKHGWKTAETEAAADEVNRKWKTAEPNGVIQFLGSVTEEEKWYLLSNAACLLFPSYHEGFGLPLLEAMSVGTPVITSTAGALSEVGGDAVMYADPEDIQTMSLAIAQCVLLPEGLQNLREEGYRRARSFSWEETAKKTIALLRSI